jgi:hypothetical protein
VPPSVTLSYYWRFYLWISLTKVGLFILINEVSNPDYFSAGYQGDGRPQMSSQSVNGPNTFDEALKYFEFSVEERHQIAGGPFYASSPNAHRIPAVHQHLSHLSPQGGSTQPMHHSYSQYAPPAQGMSAAHHQGTQYSRASPWPFLSRSQFPT